MTKMTPPATAAPVARLAAGSIALLLVGVLAGCGAGDDATTSGTTSAASGSSTSAPSSPSSTSSTSSSSASSSSSSSTSPAGRTLEVTVRGKDVTPAPATVDLGVGETLTLVVTSDHDDELHAHGFEVEAELTADKPTTITLTGKQPGVYEVETHHPALRLLKIAVR